MQIKNSSATLYIHKDTWIQRLHPFTKLCNILLTGVVIYVGPLSWKLMGLVLIINIFFIISGLLLKEMCQVLWRIMLPLLLFMIPIHSLLYPGNKTVLLAFSGITVYQEGLYFALITLFKLTVVLITSLLFVLSTHPADLITSISHTGKSPSLAYLLGSPLLLLADMRARIEVIKTAQQARGLQTSGNILRRCLSLAPLILPLVTGAIVAVEQRAIALEVRGFKSTSEKTYLRILTDSRAQRLSRWLMLAAVGFIILFRLIA